MNIRSELLCKVPRLCLKGLHPFTPRKLTPARHVFLSRGPNEFEDHLKLVGIAFARENRSPDEHLAKDASEKFC
jgi:hypothetical protein